MSLYNPTPGEMFKKICLESRNLSVSEFAQKSGMPLNQAIAFIYEKQSVTPDISDTINAYFKVSFDWLGMQEDYENREKDHQARRDIVQSVRDIENILSEYLGFPVQLGIQVKEDDDVEDLRIACKKAILAFDKIITTIEKKEEYLEQKKQLEEYIQAYEKQNKANV